VKSRASTTPRGPQGWHSRVLVWGSLVFLVGLAVRLFFVAYSPGRHGDSALYSAMAANLLDRGAFALNGNSLTICRPPGYPLFMAGIYMLAGRTQEAILISQAVVGAGTGCLLYGLLRRIVSGPVAIATALLTAASPELAYYAGSVLSETLLAALVVLLVYAVHRSIDPAASRGVSRRFAITAGLAAGAALLVTPRFVAAPLLAAVALMIASPSRRRFRHAILCVILSACVFLPWTIRNYRAFGTLSPSVQTSARMLWLAAKHAPPDDWRLDPLFQSDPLVTRYGDVLADAANEQARIGERLALERELFAEALKVIARDPLSYLRDRLRTYPHVWLDPLGHVGLFVGPLSFANQHMGMVELLRSGRTGAAVLRGCAIAVFFLIPVILVVAGFVIGRRRWRELALAYALVGWVAVTTAPVFIEHRFTVPLHPVLAIFAAVAMDWILGLPWGRWWRGSLREA
jgi:4-amino-4-deoxy-L-arabinose transferase-like glycosyltransferase